MSEYSLVWCDLETGGTDPDHDPIYEVAIVLTDPNLNEKMAYQQVIYQPSSLKETLHPKVQAMHDKNGLFTESAVSKLSLKDVETDICRLLHFYDVIPGSAYLAGSSVHFDRSFIRAQMPLLYGWLHYRQFDVSTIKTAVAMWCGPTAIGTEKENKVPAHRAMSDIRYSLRVARCYREMFFAPLPSTEKPQEGVKVAT